MQCFICFAYLLIICTAHPPKDRESPTQQRRSLFRDVIESLRIRAQLPEEFSEEENHLKQSFEKFNYENDLNLPDDFDFLPRRNDRLEMPTLKYRFPKSLDINDTKGESAKEEIVLYINSPEESETTTFKPKNTKRPRPTIKNKIKTKESEEPVSEQKPVTNSLTGFSQIGNRESQTVVKPTVIVNFRGTVSNRESDIRLERRKNVTKSETVPQNIFNINQEIKLERSVPNLGNRGDARVTNKVKQDVTIQTEARAIADEDMMMCESNSWKKSDRNGRQLLQILVTV
ncbi:unnamed protein product [Pieris macdunnoughi]|uniref:Uncharacterized protein n=1 Tax=Pieris macdunnoughi TaxID=345717 RepID=A0A821LQ32_9NEOP|nr:unnamed protein product [Pieris macdunnoughi]